MEWHGACLTCHVINYCLEARAAILRIQHRVKEGQAMHLHLCAACQMGEPAWCCKLSLFEQTRHVKVKDLQSGLSNFKGLCNNALVISRSHRSNLLCTEQRRQMRSWEQAVL